MDSSRPPPTLSATKIRALALHLNSVLSVRGPKLAFRCGTDLWVLRAGDQPRAWSIQLDTDGKARGAWAEKRPPADHYLVPPALCQQWRRQFIQRLRHEAAMAKDNHGGLSDAHLRNQRQDIRAVAKLTLLERWSSFFPAGALDFLQRHQFKARRWHLLNLWARVPEGRQLFGDIPALAWLLASSWCYKRHPVQRPLRSIRALVKKPRRHLLRWLDLPEGDGTLRLLRTLNAKALDLRLMHAVCKVLRDEEKRRWWSSLPLPVDYAQLCLMAYDVPVSFEILRAINLGASCGPADAPMTVLETWRHTCRLIAQRPGGQDLRQLQNVRSPGRLRRLHDELARAMWAGPPVVVRGGHSEFQLGPPLEHPAWLQPLCNTALLHQEGVQMRHCVGSYASRVTAGRCYLFAVIHPLGRATLSIRPGGMHWVLEELRGERNHSVPAALREEVQRWLRSALPRQGYQQDLAQLSSRGAAKHSAHHDDDDFPFEEEDDPDQLLLPFEIIAPRHHHAVEDEIPF